MSSPGRDQGTRADGPYMATFRSRFDGTPCMRSCKNECREAEVGVGVYSPNRILREHILPSRPPPRNLAHDRTSREEHGRLETDIVSFTGVRTRSSPNHGWVVDRGSPRGYATAERPRKHRAMDAIHVERLFRSGPKRICQRCQSRLVGPCSKTAARRSIAGRHR
jgi:hypothetical protein